MWEILKFCPKIRQGVCFFNTKWQYLTINTTVKNKYVLQFADNQQKDPITAYEQRMKSTPKVPSF